MKIFLQRVCYDFCLSIRYPIIKHEILDVETNIVLVDLVSGDLEVLVGDVLLFSEFGPFGVQQVLIRYSKIELRSVLELNQIYRLVLRIIIMFKINKSIILILEHFYSQINSVESKNHKNGNRDEESNGISHLGSFLAFALLRLTIFIKLLDPDELVADGDLVPV